MFRPVGQEELDLIRDSDLRESPLPHQPIHYPVLTEEYAVKIARDWNTPDLNSGNAGYVTRFPVRRDFLSRYSDQQAGGPRLAHSPSPSPAGLPAALHRSARARLIRT